MLLLLLRRLCCGVHQARQVWWVYDRWCMGSRGEPQAPADLALNVAAMQEAATYLLGTHDFTSFQDVKRPSGGRTKELGLPCRSAPEGKWLGPSCVLACVGLWL